MLTKNKTYSVLITDDHPLILFGIAKLLHTSPLLRPINKAKNAEEVIEMYKSRTYDVLVTDIGLPGMNGNDLSKFIKLKYPQTKILVYTQFKEISLINELLEIDVEAIVSKESDNRELIIAIESILKNRKYFSDDISHLFIENMAYKKRMKTDDIQLTKREKQVLNYLANENTTREIAQLMGISFNTVETYRKNLISKFNVKNTVGLIKIAIEKKILD